MSLDNNDYRQKLNRRMWQIGILGVVLGSSIGILPIYAEYPARLDKTESLDFTNAGTVITNTRQDNLTRIETDTGVFYIKPAVSTMNSANVTIAKDESGRRFLCLGKDAYCHRIHPF